MKTLLTSKFLDKFGREVKPGDRVAYSMTWGRSAVLALGTALEVVLLDNFNHKGPALKWQRGSEAGWDYRPSVIYNQDNLIIINDIEEPAKDAD